MPKMNDKFECSCCHQQVCWSQMFNDTECWSCMSERSRKKVIAEKAVWYAALQERLAADLELYKIPI